MPPVAQPLLAVHKKETRGHPHEMYKLQPRAGRLCHGGRGARAAGFSLPPRGLAKAFHYYVAHRLLETSCEDLRKGAKWFTQSKAAAWICPERRDACPFKRLPAGLCSPSLSQVSNYEDERVRDLKQLALVIHPELEKNHWSQPPSSSHLFSLTSISFMTIAGFLGYMDTRTPPSSPISDFMPYNIAARKALALPHPTATI